MNIDNSGIENTQSAQQSDDTSAIEQTPADAEYEAAFTAELAADEGLSEDSPGVGQDMTQDEANEIYGRAPDVAAIEALEIQAGAEDDGEGDAKPKAPPAYIAFIAAVEAHARALGLSVKEQKSFFQFGATTGHKLYVEKALKKNVGRVDTSLPRSALVVNGKDISLPLSKPNGRIACHVDPSVESVKQALEVLATYSDKIPAPKKPAAKDQAAA